MTGETDVGARALGRPTNAAASQRLLKVLAGIVGTEHVLVEPGLRAGFERDWTGRFGGPALAVVRPADAGQVAAVLTACEAGGQPVVPQGGNTGLVGGGVPRGGEVVLSLRRLARIEPVDADAGDLVAGAGATLSSVHRAAGSAGLAFGVDFASRDAATVGGMIATNAGGIHVLAHGPMRAQLLGIEAVLADGRVIRRLAGVRKDNTGYDLAGLIAGSEGTLAVVTAARLRLVVRPRRLATAFVGLEDTTAAVALVAAVRLAGIPLVAAEIMYDDGLDLVLRHTGLGPPLERRCPVYVLLESAADDPLPALVDALDAGPPLLAATAADDSVGRQRLWRVREAHAEAVAAEGIPHKLDVAVAPAVLAEFEARVRAGVASVAPGTRTVIWGHIADGNLHVNVLGPAPDDTRVDDAILALVVELGGAISAEHGIGVAKTRWLVADRGAEAVGTMRAIKTALDPAGILNPGVLLPDT